METETKSQQPNPELETFKKQVSHILYSDYVPSTDKVQMLRELLEE